MKRKFQVLAVLRSQISKSRSFQVIALFAIVAFCACSQMAFARPRSVAAPRAPSQVQPETTTFPAPGLYAVTQAFTVSPYPNWTNNPDGFELWPCFGNDGLNGDCPTIGNPAIGFDGLAIGSPFFAWYLGNCDGTTNGTQVPYVQGETWNAYAINGFYVPCGQIFTFYQDYASDNTDDLLWSAVVTQGLNLIADTGIQDWGRNQYGGGGGVVFYQDFNFGALGDIGPNNGNCVPNYNYPTSSVPTSYPLVIAAGKTCVDPVAGPATITVTTALATPTWTCITKLGVTTCTVKYSRKYSLKQQWNIFLQ
jgi:hypothetical protein